MTNANLSADSRSLLDAVSTDNNASLRRILHSAQQLLTGECKQADEAALCLVAAQAQSKLAMDSASIIDCFQRAFDRSKGIEGLEKIRAVAGTRLAVLYEEAGEHDKSITVATELSMEMHHETLERLGDLD